ncbi:MAG: phosphoglucosamine mutase [Clostridia bacterium]
MKKYFGTDGIRRIANTELSPQLVYRVAKAGAYVLSKNTEHNPTILIGRDTRISGTLIESAMIAGFLSYGANVKTLGVISTPAVAYLTKKTGADASVVISASHNTFEFNGIKFFSNKGMKISDEIEEQIEQIMDSNKLNEIMAVNEKIGISENYEYLIEEYIEFIIEIFKNNIKDKINPDFSVVIDAANGATYKIADEIFTKLGIIHTVINNTPNGININDKCGSTHLEMLKEYVKKYNYSLGIAYDGDGDRCLAVDENGAEIDGDIILAICSKYLSENNMLKKDTIVATVMSNLGLNKYLNKNNLNLIQTKVGDRYVLEEMLNNGYNLGGEQSGHIIFLDYNPTGDGILTSLMLIQILLHYGKKASNMKDLVNIYPQVLVNVKINNNNKFDIEKDSIIKEEIKKLEEEFNGNGRVLIRPSGTEPLVRVMIEAQDKKYITKKANEVASLIKKRLG